MTIAALIFDFDGLILDTETPDFDVLAELYLAHGHELQPERWVHGLGTVGGYDAFAELEELAGRPLDRERLRVDHRARFMERVGAQPLRPGVLALLEHAEAQGIALAVASSASRDWVEGWLARHGIRRFFRCVRTRTEVPRVKPAPDLFLAAGECLGVPPPQCVVLEDSPNGLRAAAAAGMRAVAVPLPLLSGLDLPPHALRLGTIADMGPAELLAALAAD